jgi:outer membrane protein assembly factor BamB
MVDRVGGGARPLAALAALLLLGVLLASCGDDESDGSGSSTDGSTGADTATGEAATSAPLEDVSGELGDCDWAQWGHGLDRTFSTPCETAISPESVPELGLEWFFNTDDVVTATPAVAGETAYVGDWSGRFYALDLETGGPRWTFQADLHEEVYAGQIVSSAAVADGPDGRTVWFGAGKTLYALDARTGEERWRHELGEAGNTTEPTEIESSPLVVGELVVFGYDVHNSAGFRAGLRALDATTGELVWDFDPDLGAGPTGCVDVWSSPSVDEDLGLVFAGTGNCDSAPEGWGPYTEAMFAVDLATGEPAWSYQPHEVSNDDFDFAGAPNLFEADGRSLVGLGNKDASYYAVDRETGEEVWQVQATEPGLPEPGGGFSTGGFIGPTAYADGTVVGGTAVGECPCLHAIDAATGDVRWQSDLPGPTYAASAEANGVVFLGGTDAVLRGYALDDGEVLWEEQLRTPISGGAVVAGDSLVAVAGIREPGLDTRSENSGVYRFTLGAEAVASTTTTVEAAEQLSLEPTDQPCVDATCELEFVLKEPPAGLTPTATLEIATDPFTATVGASGLGEPDQWLRPNGPASAAGATEFGLFISDRDDDPTGGGLICILSEDDAPEGAELGCSGSSIPRLASTYNRISVVAVQDADTEPTLADGFDRLVTTTSFDPPLTVVDG